jgi:hypothetical protein
MERQREYGQTASRSGVRASGPRERQTTLVPRTTRNVPAPGPRSGPLAPRAPTNPNALAPYAGERWEDSAPTIVAPSATRPVPATLTPRREPAIKPWMRLTAGLIAVIACIVGVLGYQLAHPAALGDKVTGASSASKVPEPSGRGPLTATIGVIVAVPPPQAQHSTQSAQDAPPAPTYSGSLVVYGITSIQPCHDATMFIANISQWATPPGCYGLIYRPDPANYLPRASWGWCNWWVEETHPQDPNITGATSYPRGTTPVANAAVFIDGYEQGASPEGHWAESVAVSPDGYWILISEMNFAWRGAGWGLIDYRYIHASPHVHFLYGV